MDIEVRGCFCYGHGCSRFGSATQKPNGIREIQDHGNSYEISESGWDVGGLKSQAQGAGLSWDTSSTNFLDY
jgi:hypothetical protein